MSPAQLVLAGAAVGFAVGLTGMGGGALLIACAAMLVRALMERRTDGGEVRPALPVRRIPTLLVGAVGAAISLRARRTVAATPPIE